MPINHSVTVTTVNNFPDPTGTPVDPSQPSPTSDNPLQCAYPCTMPDHTDTVQLIFDGSFFSLPDVEANDPNYGTVSFTYVPPLV